MRVSLWKKMFSKNHAIFQQENFRLCLFWVKITFENAFPYLRVFGCAWKMHFPEMVFSWPCVGCKLISVFILPSNTIFWKTERERERELSESEIEEEERGREHTDSSSKLRPKRSHPESDRTQSPESFDFAVRLRLRRLTSNRALRIAPFNFAVQLRLRADRDRSCRIDSSSPIANPDSSSPIAISPSRRSRS